MEKKPLKLMIPGPIQPDDEVLEEMGAPVRPHYGAGFTRFYNETLDLLKQVFHTKEDVFVMNGSGTVAIDACLGSALSTGEKIIIPSNGFFGERLAWVAESYGLQVVRLAVPWGRAVAPYEVAAIMREHPDAAAVAIVHLETSTTVANPIDQIGPLVRAAGKVFFVDAVSSLGGLPFEMDNWCVDMAAAASQKCLGAPPGLAPVAVGKRAWEAIDRNPNKGHGWYGDLRVWRKYAIDWADWHPFPITMATNNLAALNKSLTQLCKEGIEPRLERYRGLALRLRHGLRNLGLEPFTPDNMLAPVLTAAFGPPGVKTTEIVSYLENKQHIKISAGLGMMKEQLIRIGHMSPTVGETDIDQVLAALEEYLKEQVALPAQI